MGNNFVSGFKDDDQAFRYLYEKYVAMLRYFTARYVDDDQAIEDIVQSAFLSLWEKREDFMAENAMKAYLYKIVRSFSIDLIRHNQVVRKHSERIVRENDDSEFFLENIIEAEVFQLVQTVFNELSPAERRVYQLSLQGKSHDEIARQLDISVNTVKKHKNNANHYMRDRLKNLLSLLIMGL